MGDFPSEISLNGRGTFLGFSTVKVLEVEECPPYLEKILILNLEDLQNKSRIYIMYRKTYKK